jgi:pyridoxal phosphate enzyme (YggS family)
MTVTWMQRMAANLASVKQRIAQACDRSERSTDSVKLLCVTKQRERQALEALQALGETRFGENRVQALRDRAIEFPTGVEWHLIGSLQTNKAKYLPGIASCVHSVDRIEAGEALHRAWEKYPQLPDLPILVQVNIAGEEQKHGVDPDKSQDLIRELSNYTRIRVVGLMTMAPFFDEPEPARPTFAGLRLLRDRLQDALGQPLPELSMGMTGDFEVAIEEGATIVRVGTALFE